MEYIGRADSLVFFANKDLGVVLDDVSNVVIASGSKKSVEKYAEWGTDDFYEPSEALSALASAAVSSLNIEVLSSSDRMHTIPKAVVAEAKRALEWRKEYKRGGTPVGMNTARTLAEGGQLGIKKIRHIARYFPRHEVDKKGKGYKPGEDGYPSNGRIAWALWGGDAAQKWASAIVERENKKAVTAGVEFHRSPSHVELEDFSNEDVRFVVRMRKHGGFDRLYRVNAVGDVSVWDDGCWDNLGNIEHDIDTYDSALDDPYDQEEKKHVPVDTKTAVALAALFDSNPFTPVSLEKVSPQEWELFTNAKHELDWDQLSALTADAKKDGNYTPQERSENVKSQVRDAEGKFAEKGGRVQVGKNPMDRGVIQKIDDETGMATVLLDSGATVKVSVSDTKKEDPSKPVPAPVPEVEPVDTSGILGESKEIKGRNIARLPKKLPVIGPEKLRKLLADYPAWVQSKRDRASREALLSSAERLEEEYKKPSESDVDPLYFAIVAEDDPQAVMEVVSLIPSSPKSNAPMTFKRSPGEWERDDSILSDLNSPTPPPVIQLDKDTLADVMKQVDSAAITASVSRGSFSTINASRLKNYWLSGAGAEKIKWSVDGSWERCVDHMAKYMGAYAKGYCALRHREATGEWINNENVPAIVASGAKRFNEYQVASEEVIIENAAVRARMSDARKRVLTASGGSEPVDLEDGSEFFIPLVIPEGVESGDGRIFSKDSIDIRELPLPLLWQIKTGEGHNGSVVVGRIDHMEKTEDGIGNARGVFDSGEYGREAERLVKGGFIRGVSADLDKFEASEETEASENSKEDKVSTGRIKISKARVMAVTLVPKPAFQECTIQIVEDDQEDEVVPDGVYVEGVDPVEASALVACGITAGVIPTTPPSAWFEKPNLDKPTPLTVDDEGRVFGHIAAWHVDHIGMSFGTKPPRSRSGYSYFHTGVVRTEEGSDVPVGQLTLAGGHASLELSASQAVRHYDDTASAIADVHAGEDAYGIWVAGALRPGTTPEQIRALRASAPSGDWRPIKGHLELVAVCQVNVPGFPIARSRVASGQVMALVAAGASVLAHMKSDPVAELQARIDRLEREPLEMAADQARQKVLAIKAEELATKVKKAKEEIEDEEEDVSWMLETFDGDTDSEDSETGNFSVISMTERRRLVHEGKAMPDGSFPIRNWKDLKVALKAWGKARPEVRVKAKKHIERRAKMLRRERMLPEKWTRKRNTYQIDDIPEGVTAAADNPCWDGYVMIGMKTVDGKEVPNCVPEDSTEASLAEFKYFSPEKREEMAKKGLALPDGSFPIENSRDLKNAIWAFGRAKPEKRAEVKEHIIKRAKELDKEDMLPEIWEGQGSKFSAEDDDETFLSIRERIAIVESVVAAGGLDRNRGNAERLRRYWVRGPGALKIRWGTPGDWKRCVKNLAKYMGPRAKGYCQLRHKEATGVYTGSKFNPGRKKTSIMDSEEFTISEALFNNGEYVETSVTEEDMLTPLDWIYAEEDPLYDAEWEPDPEIISLCEGYGSEWEDEDLVFTDGDSYGEEEDTELYDYDDFDSSFALKDKNKDKIPDDLTPEEIEALKMEKMSRDRDMKVKKKGRYTPQTQPRDAAGKFRKVLGRLKVDLGVAGLSRALEKVEEIENLDFSGDYTDAAKASGDLIDIIDRLDTKALNPDALENIRSSTRELGKVIANLPFAFGEDAQKIRYSDLPPALKSLVKDMITRVETKIGKEDSDDATKKLRSFISGSDVFNQSEVSSELSKLLRLLT